MQGLLHRVGLEHQPGERNNTCPIREIREHRYIWPLKCRSLPSGICIVSIHDIFQTPLLKATDTSKCTKLPEIRSGVRLIVTNYIHL